MTFVWRKGHSAECYFYKYYMICLFLVALKYFFQTNLLLLLLCNPAACSSKSYMIQILCKMNAKLSWSNIINQWFISRQVWPYFSSIFRFSLMVLHYFIFSKLDNFICLKICSIWLYFTFVCSAWFLFTG